MPAGPTLSAPFAAAPVDRNPPGCGEHERAGRAVDHVVVCAWRMVDAVFSASGRAPFEADQLCSEPSVVEQFDAA